MLKFDTKEFRGVALLLRDETMSPMIASVCNSAASCCDEIDRLRSLNAELLSALLPFLQFDEQRSMITGGQWNAAIVTARAVAVKARGETK